MTAVSLPSEAASKAQIEEFLERAYREYPRKLGKGAGMKILLRKLHTKTDCERFAVAMSRFIEYHASEGTQKQYVPYWSTFSSNFEDWLDEYAGVSKDFSKDFNELFAGIRGLK